MRLLVALVVAVVGATYVASTGAFTLRSGSKLTVTPPAYYAGSGTADVLIGTDGNDVLVGRGGNDRIEGRGGQDVLRGDTGNDRLFGGKGRDYSVGGAGNDRLYARDAQRDTVDGGPGFDEAWVDRVDVVRNVERVHRP
jgi:RTX calcium-binding nonapeptide repeat (4 copies)